MILTQIAQWGLDPANIVDQGYDGSGNMSGRTRHVFHHSTQQQHMYIVRITA